jgi:hypothetical protein
MRNVMFVVSFLKRENDGIPSSKTIGVFDNKKLAGECLDALFHKTCDYIGRKELGTYEYYTECDSFHLETDMMDIYDGKIEKATLNQL